MRYSEIIGIIDTTLACIVSWLEGHSLAQTVFTNLYLHKPYSIEDKILKAFSLAIYKLIDIIKDFIHKYFGFIYLIKIKLNIFFTILGQWFLKRRTFNRCNMDIG